MPIIPDPITFSLIIPCRNEMEHIGGTIECCLDLDYPHKEIIVVDDSTDDTPKIIERYADRGVRLIHRTENRNGCCGARNLGMQNATGDVVVIINGDVRPEKDFLTRLAGHYRDGAEWATCTSRAVNVENIWARYIHAVELDKKNRSHDWSEGFSCLRSAADRIGYIPGDFPIPFCRDFMIGERLAGAGYRKHEAREIIMSHIAHDSFAEFWGVRVNRGSWSPINRLCFKTYTPAVIVLREILKTVRYVFLTVTLFYHIIRAWRYSRHVGFTNLPAFLAISLIEQTAFTVGNFKGLRKMFRYLRGNQAARPETV